MGKKKFFGLTEEQVKSQIKAKEVDIDPERKIGPLRRRGTLDPCIEGGDKILLDHHTQEMLRRIYRGK